MSRITPRQWNEFGRDGQAMLDENGRSHHVPFKTQAVRAAQDTYREMQRAREVIIEAQRLLEAGEPGQAAHKLRQYNRAVYPGALYDQVLGGGQA